MTTPTEDARWTDARIREAFIYDGGESEYHDPINGAQEQRRMAGAIFDAWLAEHDAEVRRQVSHPEPDFVRDMAARFVTRSSPSCEALMRHADRLEAARAVRLPVPEEKL